MTKVEVQVQDGKVIICIGGETASNTATLAHVRSAAGETNSVPSEPPDPPGEANSVIVIGPVVLGDATETGSSGQKDEMVFRGKNAPKEDAAAAKTGVKQSSSPDHRVVVIGPICLPNGAKALNSK
jgi:hypothetical protein